MGDASQSAMSKRPLDLTKASPPPSPKRARLEPVASIELLPELVRRIAYEVCGGVFFEIDGRPRHNMLALVKARGVRPRHETDACRAEREKEELIHDGIIGLRRKLLALFTMGLVCVSWFQAIDWFGVCAALRAHLTGLRIVLIRSYLQPSTPQSQQDWATRACLALARAPAERLPVLAFMRGSYQGRWRSAASCVLALHAGARDLIVRVVMERIAGRGAREFMSLSGLAQVVSLEDARRILRWVETPTFPVTNADPARFIYPVDIETRTGMFLGVLRNVWDYDAHQWLAGNGGILLSKVDAALETWRNSERHFQAMEATYRWRSRGGRQTLTL